MNSAVILASTTKIRDSSVTYKRMCGCAPFCPVVTRKKHELILAARVCHTKAANTNDVTNQYEFSTSK